MRRTILSHALLFLLGLALGALLLFLTLTRGWLPNTRVTIVTNAGVRSVNTISTTPAALEERLAGNPLLLARAVEAAGFMRDGDWGSLAGLVHPELGVRFTPYSSVSPDDLCFSPEEVAAFGSDERVLRWGFQDGSGAPLSMTPRDYFGRYVYNADYTQAPFLSLNRVSAAGNAVENVTDAYPKGRFVEFYYDGLDPAREGFDWCALKLVFQEWDGRLMLVGVIHSEWTI